MCTLNLKYHFTQSNCNITSIQIEAMLHDIYVVVKIALYGLKCLNQFDFCSPLSQNNVNESATKKIKNLNYMNHNIQ